MKKSIIILLGVLFLTSCGSKKKTTYHKNNKQIKVKSNPKKVVKKYTKPKDYTKVNKNLQINISENKTVYDKDLLNVIYANKPQLMIAKVNYIKKYCELAIHEMEVYKIPASITLAQGLLESRYGKSVLTTKAKNHFGIKCHKWEGDRVYHDDDAKGECFRKYQMHESSFRDHSLFLAHKKRYAKLFKFAPNDYKSWARGLRAAGYATDKKYPQKLINLIEEYELYYFDNLVLGEEYVSKEEMEETKEISNKKSEEVKEQIIVKNIKVDKQKDIKNNKFYTVKEGETLYGISKITNISIDKLKKINNLNSNEISIGQQLQLFEVSNSSKENNVVKNVVQYKEYIVKTGDTIYSIARNNNTTVNDLLKINKLESNNISIGQILIIDEIE